MTRGRWTLPRGARAADDEHVRTHPGLRPTLAAVVLAAALAACSSPSTTASTSTSSSSSSSPKTTRAAQAAADTEIAREAVLRESEAAVAGWKSRPGFDPNKRPEPQRALTDEQRAKAIEELARCDIPVTVLDLMASNPTPPHHHSAYFSRTSSDGYETMANEVTVFPTEVDARTALVAYRNVDKFECLSRALQSGADTSPSGGTTQKGEANRSPTLEPLNAPAIGDESLGYVDRYTYHDGSDINAVWLIRVGRGVAVFETSITGAPQQATVSPDRSLARPVVDRLQRGLVGEPVSEPGTSSPQPGPAEALGATSSPAP